MSHVTNNQPDGTPTWIDLGIPDLDRAVAFYGALFGWEFDVGPAEYGHYTHCLLNGRQVAAIVPSHDPDATEFWWNVYLATSDVDSTVRRAVDAGGTVVTEPMDIMQEGRMALLRDSSGAQFGLWQGRNHIGCEVVNEPNALVRNDLSTPDTERAKEFYPALFGYTLERNEDMPDLDFTFLRRPDGHEVAGILSNPAATKPTWDTTFEVADTDAAVERARSAGGTADDPQDIRYGRIASITDPFGVDFNVIARA